jgi:hypothetical protein
MKIERRLMAGAITTSADKKQADDQAGDGAAEQAADDGGRGLLGGSPLGGRIAEQNEYGQQDELSHADDAGDDHPVGQGGEDADQRQVDRHHAADQADLDHW